MYVTLSSCWSGRRPSCPVGIDRGDDRRRRCRYAKRLAPTGRGAMSWPRVCGTHTHTHTRTHAGGRRGQGWSPTGALIALVSLALGNRGSLRSLDIPSRLCYPSADPPLAHPRAGPRAGPRDGVNPQRLRVTRDLLAT
jgi:hypothetical protein